MAETNKFSWVFDSLVEFLKGPIWNIPILTFTEQKSVVFEPGTENEAEFRKIHNEYKNLVDFMLGSYMEDLQINPEDFEKACLDVSGNVLTNFEQTLFEQVWAADDYEIFKRMMTQKNIELQLQALEVLTQQYGLSPDFMVPEGSYVPTKEEESIMQEVLKKTMEEHKVPEGKRPGSKEHAIQATLAEKTRLEEQRQRERELLDQALKRSLEESASPVKQKSKEIPSTAEKDTHTQSFHSYSNKEASPEEIEKRQAYLRQQRDRMLALKRQERTKHLAKYEAESSQKRPKSARAARSVLKQEQNLKKEPIDPKTLLFRKSLANQLKSEVIDKN